MPEAIKEEISKEEIRAQLEREGKIIYVSGPRTMGAKLKIADKEVQLPADAYVKDYIVDFDCAPAMPCAEEDQLPMLVIARGKSELWISEPTGKIFLDRTDAAERETFRFMEEVGLK